ncbi:MAG TPA: hypothetical protein P5560_05470 [Thermotogota bacterium]|nr:hypothetical protein [Thermotogota bacterium]HRW92388.1 hypothetical protein [Thermotogota bacterium]
MYWTKIDDVIYVLLFFACAILLKRFVPFFRRFIIPNAILAGFFGLILGPNLLNWVPLDVDVLGQIIYHLMAIGFISLSLRQMEKKKDWNSLNAGLIIVSTYLVQGILGFAMSLLWNLADKGVSPIIGMLLPLGFGQGPGQAYSIGSQWQTLGLPNGSAVGLAVAAAGFGWATLGGIVILNIFAKGRRRKEHVEVVDKKSVLVKDFEFSDMDGLTIQMVIIAVVYVGVMLLLRLINWLMAPLGTFGTTFGTVLWGFHFVFGAILAFVFRFVYNKLHEKGIAKENYLNNFLLQRIAGFAFDFMVAASISAVALERIYRYFWPIFFITFAGGIFTFFYVHFVVRKTVKKNVLPNTLAFFGNLTGTISTGMALLREVDPLLETGASENLIFGSGVAIFFGLPLIALLNLPAMALSTGNTSYYLYTMGGLLVYAFFLYLFWFRRAGKHAKEGLE